MNNKPNCIDNGNKDKLADCDDCDHRECCDAEDELCSSCNGTGEGMYDGTICRSCGGKGINSQTDYVEPPDWYLEEQEERRSKYA